MTKKILAVTKLSPNLQTRVPKEVREKLGLIEGDKILWVLEEDKIYVAKAEVR
ncbi:MAG: AbrB/MazE/SpoVT family DNA-binding domain-containing protein [Nitrososphaerota archaeon]